MTLKIGHQKVKIGHQIEDEAVDKEIDSDDDEVINIDVVIDRY